MANVTQTTPICLVLRSPEDIAFFEPPLREMRFEDIDCFTQADEALTRASKKNYGVFVIRMELNHGMNGVVLVQKIRRSGIYGGEVQIFVADKVDKPIADVLDEFDIFHVISKPFSPERIRHQVGLAIEKENNLPPEMEAYRAGRRFFYQNDYDQAIILACELAKKPLDKFIQFRVQLLLASCYLMKRDYKQTGEHLRQAQNLNKSSPALAHHIAELRARLGDSQAAIKIFDTLAETNPYNLTILERAGLVNLDSGNASRAEYFVDTIKKLDCDNLQAQKLKAGVEADRGHVSAAAEILRKNGGNPKDMIKELNKAGVRLAKRQDLHKALQLYQSCLELQESKDYTHAIFFNMALAHVKLGNMNLAKNCLMRALEAKPNFDRASEMLGKLNAATKQAG